jgi:hypothetical protein
MKSHEARQRAADLKAEAERLEKAERLTERMATADKVPTCPTCGGRSFHISTWTIVSQSIEFGDDADSDKDDCEWGDDYASGDHTDLNQEATCNECGMDVQDVLEKFGWIFYDDPEASKPATGGEG